MLLLVFTTLLHIKGFNCTALPKRNTMPTQPLSSKKKIPCRSVTQNLLACYIKWNIALICKKWITRMWKRSEHQNLWVIQACTQAKLVKKSTHSLTLMKMTNKEILKKKWRHCLKYTHIWNSNISTGNTSSFFFGQKQITKVSQKSASHLHGNCRYPWLLMRRWNGIVVKWLAWSHGVFWFSQHALGKSLSPGLLKGEGRCG